MPDSQYAGAGGAGDLHRSPRRPRRVALPIVLRFALCFLPLVAAAPASATPAPRLQALLKAARIAVAGQVTAITPYDDDRAAVVTVGVDEVFKGTVPAGPPKLVSLAELHEGVSRPPLPADARGLFFLRPAPRTSFLTRTLPAGSYDELLPDFGAFIAADSPAEFTRQRGILQRIVKGISGAGLDAAAARTLTFDLLACDNPILVEDGAAGVADLKPPLSDDETQALQSTLLRTELPERVRLALVRSVGDAKLSALAPTLRKIDAPPPVMEAAWRALDAMGDGLPQQALEARLASRTASTRAAALRELLRRDGVSAIAAVGPLTISDPDPEVRRAGIDGLGELKRPVGLPPLAQAFAGNTTELRQAAARAIVAIGGEQAVSTLERLATTGPQDSQRYAVVVLMLIDDPHKTAVVERLGKTHPDEHIRRLITQGPEAHD